MWWCVYFNFFHYFNFLVGLIASCIFNCQFVWSVGRSVWTRSIWSNTISYAYAFSCTITLWIELSKSSITASTGSSFEWIKSSILSIWTITNSFVTGSTPCCRLWNSSTTAYKSCPKCIPQYWKSFSWLRRIWSTTMARSKRSSTSSTFQSKSTS